MGFPFLNSSSIKHAVKLCYFYDRDIKAFHCPTSALNIRIADRLQKKITSQVKFKSCHSCFEGHAGHNATGHVVKAREEIDNNRLREAGTALALARLRILDLQAWEDVNAKQSSLSTICISSEYTKEQKPYARNGMTDSKLGIMIH
jgi:hypothetical protein